MANKDNRPIIALTMGDPCGIGPEVIAKALNSKELSDMCRPVIIGNPWAMNQALKLIDSSLKVECIDSISKHNSTSHDIVSVLDLDNLSINVIHTGKISPACGKAAMEWVSKGATLAMDGEVDALCTAPINKEAASLAGYKAIGHMELLQEISGAAQVATMLMSGTLRVMHLTTHRSLKVACSYVKKDRILEMLVLTHNEFTKWGLVNPRIAVASLNPHASDGGLLGDEESTEIEPAVQEAQNRSVNAIGPIPGDIVFNHAIDGLYDVVLAMYHDQGHIPVKVYGFETSISVNLGLPFIRTSVDHGTAFDIAGKGVAHHQSMLEALKASISLSQGNGLPNTDIGGT